MSKWNPEEQAVLENAIKDIEAIDFRDGLVKDHVRVLCNILSRNYTWNTRWVKESIRDTRRRKQLKGCRICAIHSLTEELNKES